MILGIFKTSDGGGDVGTLANHFEEKFRSLPQTIYNSIFLINQTLKSLQIKFKK